MVFGIESKTDDVFLIMGIERENRNDNGIRRVNALDWLMGDVQ